MRTRLYRIWSGILDRCTNPRHHKYPIYGGRGITFDETWRTYTGFADWARANGYSDELQIDRIDTNGPYAPWNCRFTTSLVNNNNRRNNYLITAFGETKTIMQWTRDDRCAVRRFGLWRRLQRGLEPELAITMPSKSGSSVLKRRARYGSD